MNLFWKKMFGGLPSTSKLEKQEADLLEKMQRYLEVERSVELGEYKDLKATIKSAEFQENKKVLQNRKYQDTEEFRDYRKYNKIVEKESFKQYQETLNSNELAKFLDFQKTEEYRKISDKDAVKASEKLQAMRKFEESDAYKNYLRYHGSFIEEEYLKLHEIVSTPEFEKRNAFWANPKRWEATEEFKMNQRYDELKKNPDIIFYNKIEISHFKKHLSRELSFEENFDWNSLDASRWDFGFHYSTPKLIGNHSFTNEKQANNHGKNVSVANGVLLLKTEKERVVATAWDTKKGFVEKTFEYTADVLQSAKSFKQKYGLFRAKIRCKGNVQQTFWLGGAGKLPHVNIFHFNGKNISVGNANAHTFEEVKITGISACDFYIYSLAWTEKELIWYINDLEVFRTSANVPQEELHLVFNSFISEKQAGDTGLLEVDWVKVYTQQA